MALIDVDWKPRPRQLRQFAVMFFFFAVGFGTLFWMFADFFHWVPAWIPRVLWLTGPIVGLLGLAVPVLMRPLYIVMMAIALPIGMVVSVLMMVFIYFFVVTPIGLVMGLFGYDPMQRKFDRGAATYWIDRPQAESRPSHYFRQF